MNSPRRGSPRVMKKKIKMEDDLNYSEMEDDLNFQFWTTFKLYAELQILTKGRQKNCIPTLLKTFLGLALFIIKILSFKTACGINPI